MSGLLLDTHVWLWYAEAIADRLSPPVLTAIEKARVEHALHVSSISIWEIGMLCAKQRLNLSAPINEWIKLAIAVPGIRLLSLDTETALESTQLPGDPHGDPADRFLIAAARVHGVMLVTSDEKILGYGKLGYVKVLAV